MTSSNFSAVDDRLDALISARKLSDKDNYLDLREAGYMIIKAVEYPTVISQFADAA